MIRLVATLGMAILFLPLSIVPAASAESQDYLQLKKQLYARWEQNMHRYPTGPARAAAFEREVTSKLGRLDPGRINDFKKVCENADVAYDQQLFSAGSPPWSDSFKQGGDLDTQAPDIRAYYRMQKAARARGLKVTENGNSFSIESHEVTVHKPPSPYNNPTSQQAYERALAADGEAAEYVAQGGVTRIPTAKGTVTLRKNVMQTPVAELGDYYKKAGEARDFLNRPNVGRQDVIESLNFTNKAAYKGQKALRQAGVDPKMAIHRKSLAELDAQLGNRTGPEAVAYARREVDRAQQRLGVMLKQAAKKSAQDVAVLKKEIEAAQQAGNTAKATALRQQLINTRNLMRRVAVQSGQKELVRGVASGADDAADAGGRGVKFLQKSSENFDKLSPALKKLGGIAVTGVKVLSKGAEVYVLYKEAEAAEQRESDFAKRVGRDPSYGGMAKEFLFGALGFHRAKEAADRAMIQQGRDPKEMFTWDYLKTFVAAEIDQMVIIVSPTGASAGDQMAEYIRNNPEFARQMVASGQATVVPDRPARPAAVAPPPMVAGSMPQDEKAEDDEAKVPELPPMILASLRQGEKQKEPPEEKEEPPPMVRGSGTSVPEPPPQPPKPEARKKPAPKPRPEPEQASGGFNPGQKYTIQAIALETEQRVCKTGSSSSETFETLVSGSEISVVVRQNGQDHLLSGSKAQYLLQRQGYIRNQRNCGYVTTAKYQRFGPGITQSADTGPKKSFNECVEQYCPGCGQRQLLGAAFDETNTAAVEGRVADRSCVVCLENNQAKINRCAGN